MTEREHTTPATGPELVSTKSTRRRFLVTGVKITGAAVAIGVVVTGSGVLFPRASDGVIFPEATCGLAEGRRLLVAYASRFGTTGEVAEATADAACQQGMLADTKAIGDVANIGDYDAVIIGAPINYDNWMSEARDFVTDNETALSNLPVAYFFTCGTLFEPTAENRNKAQIYADKLENLSERVAPVEIGQFAGVLDYSRMDLRTRIAMRIPSTLMGVDEGDYRDWDAIRSWSHDLPLESERTDPP